MGAPMARNLLEAGHALVVFDVVPRSVAALGDAGAPRAATAAKLAASQGRVRHHDAALLAACQKPSTSVTTACSPARSRGDPLDRCSTIDPHCAREVAAAAAIARQSDMADAPVSGGTGGAAAGTLTFMVGAASALFDRIKPILRPYGQEHRALRRGGQRPSREDLQ